MPYARPFSLSHFETSSNLKMFLSPSLLLCRKFNGKQVAYEYRLDQLLHEKGAAKWHQNLRLLVTITWYVLSAALHMPMCPLYATMAAIFVHCCPICNFTTSTLIQWFWHLRSRIQMIPLFVWPAESMDVREHTPSFHLWILTYTVTATNVCKSLKVKGIMIM